MSKVPPFPPVCNYRSDSVLHDVFTFYLEHHPSQADKERCEKFVDEFVFLVDSSRLLMYYYHFFFAFK